MRSGRMRLGVAVAGAFVSVLCTPSVSASTAIGPHQHFVGRVNGQPSTAVVRTVCGGPETPGRLGAIAGRQTLSVVRDVSGSGYTGFFSQVYAWFVPNASFNGHHAATITAYRTRVAIPTSVRVPCSGTGRVQFSSCPYLAPCAAGWVSTYVRVRFVNIAA